MYIFKYKTMRINEVQWERCAAVEQSLRSGLLLALVLTCATSDKTVTLSGPYASIWARRHWTRRTLRFLLVISYIGKTAPSLPSSPFSPSRRSDALQFWPSSFYLNDPQEPPDLSSSSLDLSLFIYTLHSQNIEIPNTIACMGPSCPNLEK